MEILMTVTELAEKMKVKRQTIYNWIDAGLPVETKSPPRFVWSDCKNWFDNRSNKKEG